MAVELIGKTGAKTILTSHDYKFGVLTQDPIYGMNHSPGGLTNSNGNTAFNTPFTLAAYFTTGNPTAGDTTLTSTLASGDLPYKLRVMKVKVTMIDEANGRLREAANSCSVVVLSGSASVGALDVSDMRQLEERSMPLSRSGGEVVAEDGSLSVKANVRLGETGVTDTLTLLVELTCMRVV